MDKPTRRSVLISGAAFAGGAAIGGSTTAAIASDARASGSTRGQYIWALNTADLAVPSHTWTRVPWSRIVLNSTTARLDSDEATWVFSARQHAGIWAVLVNVAWDNARSPANTSIAPRTHRKLLRIPQQNVATTQNKEKIVLGAASESIYHAELAALDDQYMLADGTKGFQQQQVAIQMGVSPTGPDQRTWAEVYQDSGQPLVCRFDGSSVPPTESTPAISGLQAPSVMLTKMCDF